MYRSQGKLYKVEGIILARRNVGEADKLITVFTKEYGKLRVLAKGIRRVSSRRAPHLEIFSQARMLIYRGKTLDTISEVEPVKAFVYLRNDLHLVNIAYYLCELVNLLLAEKQEHRDVYELLVGGLSDLNRGVFDSKVVLTFSHELLRMLGFLRQDKELSAEDMVAYIERITERKLRTPKLLRWPGDEHPGRQ